MLAREAEQLGYGTIWLGDAPLTPAAYSDDFKTVADPFVAMGACLASTSTIKVAHSVLLVTLRDPVAVAKALAHSYHASGGRVEVGAGLGWREEEYRYFRVGKHDRGRRMDAALDAIEAFFRGDPTFQNDYYGWFDAVPLPVLPAMPMTW